MDDASFWKMMIDGMAGGKLMGKIKIPGGCANFCFLRDGEIALLNEERFWIAKVHGGVEGALLKNMKLT